MWAIDGAITLLLIFLLLYIILFLSVFPSSVFSTHFSSFLIFDIYLFPPQSSSTLLLRQDDTHTQCWSAGNIVTFLLTPNVCFIFCYKKINTLFLWGHGVMLVWFSSLFSCSFQNQFIYCFASFLAQLFCFRFFFVTGFKTRLSNDAQVAHLNAPCV